MMKLKQLVAFAAAGILGMGILSGCGSTKEPELIQFQDPTEEQPIVTMTIRDYGDIKMMMFPEQAPKTVENFLTLAKDGYYEGVQFHRIIEDFMIQGGDPTATGAGGHSMWNKPFEDEFSDDLYNFRGALSMANSGPNTNGSQFFIVQTKEANVQTIDNLIAQNKAEGRGQTSFASSVVDKYKEVGGTPHLDGKHTVFGQVTEGMDVVDAIAATAVDAQGKPDAPVVIEKITVEE